MQTIGMFLEFQWSDEHNENEMQLADETLKLNNYTVPMAVDKLGMVLYIIWSTRRFLFLINFSNFSSV